MGTQHEDHCFLGATPFLGIIQPETESYAEYFQSTKWIWEFAQTHLNGVGCPSLSDILLQSYCNNPIDPSVRGNFRSIYAKVLYFEMEGDNNLRVMIEPSTVKVEETKKNLETELSEWGTFDKVKEEAKQKRNAIL